jgi:hypothetical protein
MTEGEENRRDAEERRGTQGKQKGTQNHERRDFRFELNTSKQEEMGTAKNGLR